MNNEATN